MKLDLSSIWENNCLVCLQKSDYKMIPVVGSDATHLELLEKIEKFATPMQTEDIKKTHIYPTKLCKNCYSDLLVAYRFVSLFEKSKTKIQKLYNKLEKYLEKDAKPSDDRFNDLCTKCSASELLVEKIMNDDSDKLYLNEEHIQSDFEMEPEPDENGNAESETDIYKKAKKRVYGLKKREKSEKCICDLCGNYYPPTQIKYHRMRHDKVKKFPCEICEKRFATEPDLRRHMRVHTGEKPYACKFCDRKFSDYGSRIKHERFHTGERPYKCKVCGKGFMYSHSLKKHQSVHTGFKEFSCSVCDRGFTKKEYLNNHMKKHQTLDPSKVTSRPTCVSGEAIHQIENAILIFEMDKSSANDSIKIEEVDLS